jgi:Fe-S cluster biogenesis protein NfuA
MPETSPLASPDVTGEADPSQTTASTSNTDAALDSASQSDAALDPASQSDAATDPASQSDAVLDSASQSDAGAEDAFHDAVAEVIKIVRPAIQADQGDIFLRGVDPATGVVSVELVGACVDCPASSQTLKQGLERILTQRVEGVTEVRHVGEALAGFDEGTRVSL